MEVRVKPENNEVRKPIILCGGWRFQSLEEKPNGRNIG